MLMAQISETADSSQMKAEEPESKPLELSPRFQRLKALTAQAS